MQQHRAHALETGEQAVADGVFAEGSGDGLHRLRAAGELQKRVRIARVPTEGKDKIERHRRSGNGHRLDAAVADARRDGGGAPVITAHDGLIHTKAAALLENARRQRAVEHIEPRAAQDRAGNGIVGEDAEVVQSHLQTPCEEKKGQRTPERGQQAGTLGPAPPNQNADGQQSAECRGRAHGDERRGRNGHCAPPFSWRR